MKPTHKIFIIGVGDDGLEGLSRPATAKLEQAKLIIGSPAMLAQVSHLTAKTEPVTADLERLADMIDRYADGPAVLLTHGDPLFYGTARFLCDRLGKERFEVLPHVSSMQLAFARVKESWEEAYLSSVVTQPLEKVVDRIRTATKVGIFTSDEITPPVIAASMIEAGLEYFTIYVCENLGSPDERVTRGSVAEIAKQKFGLLNVMVMIRHTGTPDRPAKTSGLRLFGNPDDVFAQSKPKRGLLTSSETRCMALAELELTETSIVWDVGAGTGSVAIEASMIANQGNVFAIEMDVEEYSLLQDNLKKFRRSNVTAVFGEAPAAFVKLPQPDAVFVGGTGRSVGAICKSIFDLLPIGGRLVANVNSLNNVVALQDMFDGKETAEVEFWMLQFSKANQQLDTLRFTAANPAFLVKIVKTTS